MAGAKEALLPASLPPAPLGDAMPTGGTLKVNKRLALGAAAIAAAAIAIPSLADPGRPQGGTGTTVCKDANGNPMDGSVTWSPTTIWPPNHKFQTITVNYKDTDGSGNETLMVSAPAATHNQMDSSGQEDVGAGHTPVDFVPGAPGSASDPGTATTTPQVRSERSGKDGDRIYSITVTCSHSSEADTDNLNEATGQSGTATITVTVPHDQRVQKP